MSRNIDGAPHFPASEGYFEVDYRNHNGIITLGTGEWRFDTAWSAAGSGSIHSYNDPQTIRSVAVAPGAHTIEQVTEDVFSKSNFTSRARHPRQGQVVLIENFNGFLAAIQIDEVRLSPEGEAGTSLRARFRILADLSHDFSDGSHKAFAILQTATAEALAVAQNLPSMPDEPSAVDLNSPGIGHNQPPLEEALTGGDLAEVKASLGSLLAISDEEGLSATEAEKCQGRLRRTLRSIEAFCGKRMRLIEEGFFRQVGATAALATLGLGIWATFAGKLTLVIDALAAFIP